MPTVTKTSNVSWLIWNGTTGSTVDGLVDTNAGATNPFTYSSGPLNLASLKIDTTAISPLSVQGTGQSTVLYSNSSLPFGGHTFYLSAGKTFTLTLILGFDRNVTHSVFIDSGATLNANSGSVTAGQNTIQKRGAGTWLTSTNEFGGTRQNSDIGAWQLYEGVLQTGASLTAQALGTATIGFYGGTLQIRFVRTFANTVTVNAAGGTITVDSSANNSTWSNAASGTGVLTIAGSGNLNWNNNIACSLNVTGLLSLGSSYNLSGSTLSGDGTIATNGSYTSTISSNAPSFTGSVSGNFNYSGTSKTFGGQITGTVKVDPNSSVIFSRTGTHIGALEDVKNGSSVIVRGTFAGGTSSTYTDVWYTASLTMDGPNANVSGAGNPNISVWDKGTLWLTGGATVTPLLDLTYDGGGGVNAGSPTIGTNDTNTNTYSGTLSCSGSPTRGSVKLLAKTGGVLVLSGTAVNYGVNTRPFAINGDSGYAGTIRLTGGGFNTPNAPVNLLSGKLHLNSTSTVALGSLLTVSSGAILGCSSTGAFAAQISSPVTLNSGSTMKFGATP